MELLNQINPSIMVFDDTSENNRLITCPVLCSDGTTESNQPIDNGTKKRKCQVLDDTSENNRLITCPASCLDGSNEREKKRCKKLEDFNRKQQLQMIEMRKK